ncbi:uncharacterized protein KD926_007414 [Aspergillus affinis]|uniref:uncharacterized protein n=1 Tax=Aspergillus affinis TaxID=1070780 RepID=UPI0022FE9F61|nr:uncharacterized protein KD926_007414 [Aspergillus affinis]KAI9041144.1 hypothetical protein KD926_007414 [Aspergillus affinis]
MAVASKATVSDSEPNHTYDGSGTEDDPFVVEFHKDDPGNPMSWGDVQKWFMTMIGAGWRWVQRLCTIFIGVVGILGVIFVPETYGPVLLQHRAKRLALADGKAYHALFRPWIFLFLEPIVLIASLYMAIIYGTVYMFMAACRSSIMSTAAGPRGSAAYHPWGSWSVLSRTRLRNLGQQRAIHEAVQGIHGRVAPPPGDRGSSSIGHHLRDCASNRDVWVRVDKLPRHPLVGQHHPLCTVWI